MVFFHALNFLLVPKTYVLDDRSKTGIKWQDQEHEELMNILNLLVHGHKKNNKKMIQKSLSKLIDHAAHHFFDEEQVMFSTNYPTRDITKHLRDHHILWSKIKELESEGCSDKLIQDLHIWINDHISIYDRKLANHLLDIG